MVKNSKSQKNKRKSADELVEELRTFHHNKSADLMEALLTKLRTAEAQLNAVKSVVDNETSEPADEYMEGRMAALDEISQSLNGTQNQG